MQQYQPCKIELKWPACCPRCGHDLRISPEASPLAVEPFPPATISLKETAKRLAQKLASQEKPEDVEEHLDLAIIVGNQPQQQKAVDDPVLVEPKVEPITLPLNGRIEIASKGEAKIVPPTTNTEVPTQPPLPEEELKQETPPPPPPTPVSEPSVVIVKHEPEVQGSQPAVTATANQGQSISQYYGLLPTPTQVTFTPQMQQVGQLTFNAPPPIMVPQQSQQQPVWTSQQPQPHQIQYNPCYQTAVPWYRGPPPVLVQQPQPVPPPRYVQYSTPPPVNFPFPPPSLTSFQQGPASFQQHLSVNQQVPTMVPGNGVFTVQHHFLNVMPQQQQQQQGQQFQQ